MRRVLKLIGVAALVISSIRLSGAAPNGGGTAVPTKTAPAGTDTAESLANAMVYQDPMGNMYVVNLPAPGASLNTMRIYVGNGKEMYLQLQQSASVMGPSWGATLWAPRARTNGTARLAAEAGVVTLTCQYDQARLLELVPPAKAAKLIATALFRAPLHDRVTQVLARDDDGIYYFVDRLRGEDTTRGVRVFVGLKGALKQMPMKNIVSDSAGEIYATKSGELKIVTETDTDTATWRKGKKRIELTMLRPSANQYLIARELGIYGRMGYACDEE